MLPAVEPIRIAVVASIGDETLAPAANLLVETVRLRLAEDRRLRLVESPGSEATEGAARGVQRGLILSRSVDLGMELGVPWILVLHLDRRLVASGSREGTSSYRRTRWRGQAQLIRIETEMITQMWEMDALGPWSLTPEDSEATAAVELAAGIARVLESAVSLRASVAESFPRGGIANGGSEVGFVDGQHYRVLRGGEQIGVAEIVGVEATRSRLTLVGRSKELEQGDELVQTSWLPAWRDVSFGPVFVALTDRRTPALLAGGFSLRTVRYQRPSGLRVEVELGWQANGTLHWWTTRAEAGYARCVFGTNLLWHAELGFVGGYAFQDALRGDGSTVLVSSTAYHAAVSAGLTYVFARRWCLDLELGAAPLIEGYEKWGLGWSGLSDRPLDPHASPDWPTLKGTFPQLRLLLGARF